MTVTEFIHKCDAAETLPYTPSGYVPKIERCEDGVTRNVSVNPWDESLRKLVVTDDKSAGTPISDLKNLERGLRYELVFNNNGHARLALDVLQVLCNHGILQAQCFMNLESEEWTQVISRIKGYLQYDGNSVRSMFPSIDEQRAEKALELRKRGYDIEVLDGELLFHDIGRIYDQLEASVRMMGGVWFIERMLRDLRYEPTLDRYIVPKPGNAADPFQRTPPRLPYNYMFNVGLKYLKAGGCVGFQTESCYNETAGLFADVCFVTTSVQTESIWADKFHTDKLPVEYLRDLIYRESIFDLHQSSWTRFIKPYISFLRFNKESYIDVSRLPLALGRFVEIAILIMERASDKDFVRVSARDFKSKKRAKEDVEFVLLHASLPISEWNREYCTPGDYDNVNYWQYPLVDVGEGEWLLLPKPIAARAWYEAVVSYIREYNKDVDSLLGTVNEAFVRKCCRRKKIEVISGNYTLPEREEDKLLYRGRHEGECDGLIESDEAILLIEMKKKGLIRKSRSGSEMQILIDLTESLLNSQVQSMRTCYGLTKFPGLKLVQNDGREKEILRGNRRIERMTLVMFPFGDIQDRMFVEEILRLFVRYDFDLENPENPGDVSDIDSRYLKQFKKMKESQASLRTFVDLLDDKKPFFNCWFLDMEKFLYLLSESEGPDALLDNISKRKYISFGTYDMYNEDMLRNIRQ